jgi:hypothetical protein
MAFPSTFSDMTNNVIDKGRLDKDFDIPRVHDWLNSSYFTLVMETGFMQIKQDSVTLPADSTSIPVPAGIHKIEWIMPTGVNGTPWGPMVCVNMPSIIRARAWQGGQQSTGAPSRYALRSGSVPGTPAVASIEFWPQANGGEVLHFYGWGLPPAMVADQEVSIIPEPYQRAIEYGALVHAAEFQKDVLLMQQYQADYQDWKSRFLTFKNKMDTSQPEQMDIEFSRPWPRANSTDQGF